MKSLESTQEEFKIMEKAYIFFLKVIVVSLILSLTLIAVRVTGAEISPPNIKPTIFIGDCDTGVENQELSESISMSDMITLCSSDCHNHGNFVECVAKLANDWMKEGLITEKNKDAIQSCAANSDICQDVFPPDISGTWLLYMTPQGENKKEPDCFYIYPVEDGWIHFALHESSQIRENIFVSGRFTSRSNIELEGHGLYHGEVSSLTVSATTDGDTIIGDYIHSDYFGIEEGTFKAVRNNCKKTYVQWPNHWHTDNGACWAWFNVWDLIPDDILITKATVIGPYIGTRHFTQRYDPNFWTTFEIEQISFSPEQHPLANNVFTVMVTYSDGETQTFTTHISDIEVDFPTIITPAIGSTLDNLIPTFSWQPPANGRQTRYKLEVGDYPYNVWTEFIPGDATSIVYGSDPYNPGQPLSPGVQYRWTLFAIDDAVPGTVAGAVGWFTTPSE